MPTAKTKNRSVAHSGTGRAASSTVSRRRRRAQLIESVYDSLAWVAFTVVIAAALCFFCLIAQALAAVAP